MLDWLVIGIGDITRKRVLPAILAEPRSRLVGIVTRDPAKAAPYGVPAWTELDGALKASGAAAVYVATPVHLHAPQTIACLRAGRHVLCEKPVALNYPEACSMQKVAEETGRQFGVAYYRRMYAKVNRALELIRAGAIGRPFLAEATAHEWRELPRDDWRVIPEMAGGGPLFDIGSHRIDLMNYFLGRPVAAYGRVSTLVHDIPVEDNATVVTDHEGGARGVVDVRWHSRVVRDEFRVRGTEGELDLTPLNGDRIVSPAGEESVPAPANLHFPCVAEFVSAVVDGAPLRSSGATAILTDWVTAQVLGRG
jgi:predicted dehydrogenase